MNISTVNELIQSLESAGEVSIKERKYLELAREFKRVAAENVALKDCVVNHAPAVEHWNAWADPEYKIQNAPETPATDCIYSGIKADGVTAALESCSDYLDTDCVMDRLDISYEDAEKRTSGAIEFHDAMVNFANQLREGADK